MEREIKQYFREKKWGFSVHGQEVRLNNCPFCDSDSRSPFCINSATGKAICHKCGWAGSFSTLRASQGDMVIDFNASSKSSGGKRIVTPPANLAEQNHSALMQKPEYVEKFCSVRCLTPEILKKFRIGVDTEENRGIAYPFYEKGHLVAIKYKKRTGDNDKIISHWQLKGDNGRPVENAKTKAVLFNVDSLQGNRLAIVTEGEDDCMVLVQHGFENVVSIPNGAKGTQGAFLDALEPFQDIIICFDNDRPGFEGAEKLADSLGKYRCRIATLPEGIVVPPGPWGAGGPAKDITDFARAGAIDLVINAISDAPAYKNELIAHISDFLEEIRDEFINGSRSRGRSTGFPSVDNLIGGRRYGELVVVSGTTGSGKSVYITHQAYNVAQTFEPILLGTFERSIKDIIRLMYQMNTGKWYHLQDDETGRPMDIHDLDTATKALSGYPIYFINRYGAMNVDEFIDCAAYARRRLKVPTVFLDHLHFMLRHKRGEDERQAIDSAMLSLKQCAMDHELNEWVVVHPKQRENDDNSVVRLSDFRGSSFISQIADLALIVWRDRGVNLDPAMGRARLYCIKCRSQAGREGAVDLAFEYASQRFIDKAGVEDMFKSDSFVSNTEDDMSPFADPDTFS